MYDEYTYKTETYDMLMFVYCPTYLYTFFV